MNLIRESCLEVFTEEVLEEGSNTKTLYVKSLHGIQVDLPNRNKRVYPRKIAEKKIQDYVEKRIKTGSAWGELGHPDNAKINEERISHRFTEIIPEGTNYFAVKAKVLDTNLGKVVKALVEDKEGKMGTSTRAVGTVKRCSKTGYDIVQEDLHLITAGDIVADPSAQKAFVEGIYEGVNYEWVDGVLVESVVDTLRGGYKSSMSKEEKEAVFVSIFSKLIRKL